MDIVQNKDSGLTKFEYTVIMTTLIGIFFTILIPYLMGIKEIVVMFMISLVVITFNVVAWSIIRDRFRCLFED